MSGKKFVKAFCNLEDLKYEDMVKILSGKMGKKYTYQSFYGKLTRDTLTYTEALKLADALGYDLVPVKRKG